MIKNLFQSLKRPALVAGLALGVVLASGPVVAQTINQTAGFGVTITNPPNVYVPNYFINLIITNTSGVNSIGPGSNNLLVSQPVELNPRFGLCLEMMLRAQTNTTGSNVQVRATLTSDGTNYLFPASFTNTFTPQGTNWTTQRIYLPSTNFDGYSFILFTSITNADLVDTNLINYFRVTRARLPSTTGFYPNWP